MQWPGYGLYHRVWFQAGSEAHPASYPMGTRDSPFGGGGIKSPGREADYSPPPNAEVKNL